MTPAQLQRIPYTSTRDQTRREFFLYLPAGYTPTDDKKWPVLYFLHGDGERGDTPDHLDYVLKIGPLYEAWIQKRDLPFIIVAPQLWLFGRDKTGPDYLTQRTPADIPPRLAQGVWPRPPVSPVRPFLGPMVGATAATDTPSLSSDMENKRWDQADPDVIHILDHVLATCQADPHRVYLTGISLGGAGTWYFATRYPERFAAAVPIVGYGTIAQAIQIAQAGIPLWAFSGGRDPVVQTTYFFPALNKLDELGANFRFTTEQDMGHDVWNRVYAGEDIYHWLLQYGRSATG